MASATRRPHLGTLNSTAALIGAPSRIGWPVVTPSPRHRATPGSGQPTWKVGAFHQIEKAWRLSRRSLGSGKRISVFQSVVRSFSPFGASQRLFDWLVEKSTTGSNNNKTAMRMTRPRTRESKWQRREKGKDQRKESRKDKRAEKLRTRNCCK